MIVVDSTIEDGYSRRTMASSEEIDGIASAAANSKDRAVRLGRLIRFAAVVTAGVLWLVLGRRRDERSGSETRTSSSLAPPSP